MMQRINTKESCVDSRSKNGYFWVTMRYLTILEAVEETQKSKNTIRRLIQKQPLNSKEVRKEGNKYQISEKLLFNIFPKQSTQAKYPRVPKKYPRSRLDCFGFKEGIGE